MLPPKEVDATAMPSASFLQRFQSKIDRDPDAVALYWGSKQLSYRALRDLAYRARAELVEANEQPGPVLLTGRKSPSTIAALIGSWPADLPVLVPPADLGWEALRTLAGQVGCHYLLRPREEVLPPERVLTVESVDASSSAGFSVPERTLLLLATSGSTGTPKVEAVPMMFHLLESVSEPGTEFPYVTDVLVTGDVTPQRLLPKLPKLFPQARISNVYGCTETNDSLMFEVPSGRGAVEYPLPIGQPLPGVHTRILDASGEVVSGSGQGELLVSTPFQAPGYLDPMLTEHRFVLDPAGTVDAVFFRTGDQVRRDEQGLLRLDGRNDHHVKVRGVRTNLAEVEHVLSQHQQVHEVAVIALPDEQVGHRQAVPCVFHVYTYNV